ncbi:hypothetical protein CNYM01_11613 [Colletotrichum nymphaeae SA-01]|uniref:Uncharacterized protein n=1 Tax=Colletotrichum nymphaeae SA-01 TaxID=1460502 RepID=A0A135UEG1_9PEZI|nr:hypothetical protein CNYM01_11613 [Colletotrichum nymphaeae SA-01]
MKASRAIRPTLGAEDQRALDVDVDAVEAAALKTDVFEKWRLKPMLYKDDEEEEEEAGADEPKDDDDVGVTRSGDSSGTDTQQPRTRPRAAGPNVRPASCPIGFILFDRSAQGRLNADDGKRTVELGMRLRAGDNRLSTSSLPIPSSRWSGWNTL